MVAHAPPNLRLPLTSSTNKNSSNKITPLHDKTLHESYVGCDVLLTNEWPQNVAASAFSTGDKGGKGVLTVPDSNRVTVANPIESGGSYDIAELCCLCKPRYHLLPAVRSILKKNGPIIKKIRQYFYK